MATLDDVFAVHAPPPGGLAELRARIAADERPRWRWALGGGLALGLASAAVLALVLTPGEARSPWLADAVAARDPGLVALGLAEPAGRVTVAPGAGSVAAVQRVETGVDGVLYYRAIGDPR